MSETQIAVREKPILFKGEMVRAILEGRKTQTRRIVKRNASGRVELAGKQWHIEDVNAVLACKLGQPGDRLWVKETYQPIWATSEPGDWKTGDGYKIGYVATDGIQEWVDETEGDGELTQKCKPAIFMPRWASRITLEITGVRVERLQDISEEDAKAEGCTEMQFRVAVMQKVGPESYKIPLSYRGAYANLWSSINGPSSWEANPWVWVIEFRKL